MVGKHATPQFAFFDSHKACSQRLFWATWGMRFSLATAGAIQRDILTKVWIGHSIFIKHVWFGHTLAYLRL